MLKRLLIVCLLFTPLGSRAQESGGGNSETEQAAKDKLIVETVLRLPSFDVNSNEKVKAAVMRYLDTQRGTPRYLELVERFRLTDTTAELLRMSIENPASTEAVKAASLLLEFGAERLLLEVVDGQDRVRAERALLALGYVGSKQAVEFLAPIMDDSERNIAVRNAAAMALGKNVNGQRVLLARVEEMRLPKQLEFTAANALLASPDPKIREAAGKYLTLPATADAKPLPPINELVARDGNPDKGKVLFAEKGTCAKCHKVDGQGKEVGPDLSEIGSKLSKEAMYIAILNPSAGISHNYETYLLALASGNIVSGILVSQTDDAVTIKNAEAIVKSYPVADIEEMVKQPISLMPADLQKTLTVEELVDIVAYLQTLKKKS